MSETYNPMLLKENLQNFYEKKTVFYGFNIVNDENALVQTGSGYRTMEVVDSALNSSNHSELGCGDIVRREANKLSFIIPQNYTAVFAIVHAVTKSGVANKYMRLMIGYGENGETLKEISRTNETGADYTTEMFLLGSYAGLVADSDTLKHKIVVETYGSQAYTSVNVLIGLIL